MKKRYILPAATAVLLFSAALSEAQTCSNLVLNPNGSNSTNDWTLNNGSGSFPITTTTDNFVDCFVFQNAGDQMSQVVDLTSYSLLERSTRPNITFNEKLKTDGSCTGSDYTITITLEDASNNVLETWTTGSQTTTSTSGWESIFHSFVGYTGIPDHINIVNTGSDCNSTPNTYGTEFTDISLTVLMPNTTSGSATANQKNNTVISYDDPSSCLQTGVVLATTTSDLGSTTVVSSHDGTVGTYNGQPYVQRHYEITPTTQSAASVTLYVDQTDFDDYNTARNGYPALPSTSSLSDPDLANLVITAFHGTPSGGYAPGNYVGATRELIPNNAITKVWNADASRWEFTFSIANFSGFFFSGGATPLDIHMGQLAINTRSGRHALNWETYNEASSDYFVIERSANGSDFSAIAKMQCTGKPGSYAFTDAGTPAGTSYYRIKQVNGKSGATTYSNVVNGRVNTAAVDIVSAYPSPANGVLNVRINNLQEGSASLSLTDAAGQQIKSIVATNAVTQIDIQGIPAGLYFLNCRTEGGDSQTIKVMVQ